MNSALRFIRASIVSAPLVLALSCACPKVYLPTSDSTPPTIAWKVTNLVTGAVQTGTGNDTLTAKYNQRVDVKMTAARLRRRQRGVAGEFGLLLVQGGRISL
jgi:hypothetical protein